VVDKAEIITVEAVEVPLAPQSVKVVTKRGELVLTPLYGGGEMVRLVAELVVEQQQEEKGEQDTGVEEQEEVILD
jgi:hypothetical protein